jgi:hypothetical protein
MGHEAYGRSRCTALGEDVPILGIAVLVTGGRDYGDRAKVFRTLDRLDARGHIGCIVQGQCKGGADRWAREWAAFHMRLCPDTFRADWDAAEKLTGRREDAGSIRNKKMVDTWPDLCVRFPGGKGTSNCARLARVAGIRVLTPEEILAT